MCASLPGMRIAELRLGQKMISLPTSWNRDRALTRRRLTNCFGSMVATTGSSPGLLPTLRAYRGLRVREARADPTVETLGRLGSLEANLALKAPTLPPPPQYP